MLIVEAWKVRVILLLCMASHLNERVFFGFCDLRFQCTIQWFLAHSEDGAAPPPLLCTVPEDWPILDFSCG